MENRVFVGRSEVPDNMVLGTPSLSLNTVWFQTGPYGRKFALEPDSFHSLGLRSHYSNAMNWEKKVPIRNRLTMLVIFHLRWLVSSHAKMLSCNQNQITKKCQPLCRYTVQKVCFYSHTRRLRYIKFLE